MSFKKHDSGAWVRWILLVLGIVALVGMTKNIAEREFAEAAVGFMLAVVAIGAFAFVTRARAARADFSRWLRTNAEVLSDSSALYGQQVITRETKVYTFDVAVSLLVVSTRLTSRFFFNEDRSFALTQIGATIASLLLGWWSIPGGPIFTVRAVKRNLDGAPVATVGQFLDETNGAI
jgi:hypothetical protein